MQRGTGSRLKLRQLESALQEVEAFPNPSVLLEQYPTPADLAARLLFTAEGSFGDLDGRLVADLGAGCGVLSMGAALLGAEHVLALEIDPAAASVAAANASEFDVSVDVVLANVGALPLRGLAGPGTVDTVVMNPPFGTKLKGADMLFLQHALRMARGAVYSLHKTTTREHVGLKGKEWGASGEVLAQLNFPLPKVHHFHKHASLDVQVDLWRFQLPPPP